MRNHSLVTGVTLLLLLLLLAPPARGDEGVEIESAVAPSLWVSLTSPRSPNQAGFTGSLPVELGGFHAGEDKDIPTFLRPALKDFTWDFSSGRGELFKKGSPFPCRAFAIELPVVQKRVLSAIVAGAAGATMRDRSDGSLAATLKGPLAIAVVGLKSANLSSIFPVPLALSPPSVSEHVTLLALATVSTTVSAASDWKIDGAATALLSGMIRQGVVGPPTTDAAVKAQMQKLLPYAAQDADTAQAFAQQTLYKLAYKDGVGAALSNIVKKMPADLFKPVLWLGKLPGTAPTLDLSSSVGTAPESSPIAVMLSPCVGDHGISAVDGYALPRVAGQKPYVQVLVSPYAASGYFSAKAAILRHALRAWRWTRILTPASYDPANADRNLAQTLLRLNEPIWEYLVSETVETALGPGSNPVTPQTKLDPVDMKVQDGRVGVFAARAANPFAGAAVYSSEPEHVSTGPASPPDRKLFGSTNDAYHPRSGLLPDHRIDAALFTALKTTDKVKIARQVVQAVSHGFTRPTSSEVFKDVPDDLIPDGWAHPLAAASLEPDLVWLARAAQAPAASDHPLVRPFGLLGGTRAGAVLDALARATASIGWTGQRDDEQLYFYMVASDADDRKLRSVLQYALGPLSKGAAQWDAQVGTDGAAHAFDDAWWATFKSDGAKFASLPLACDPPPPTEGTTPTAVSTAPIRCQDWAVLSRTYLRQKTLIDGATGNVSRSAPSYPYLLAWRMPSVITSYHDEGSVLVEQAAESALATVVNDADATVKGSAAVTAACIPAFDANASLVATFTGESTTRGTAMKALIKTRLKATPLKLSSREYVRLKLVSELFVPASKIEEKVWEWALIGDDARGRDLTAANPPADAIVPKLQSLLRVIAAARRQRVDFHTP